MAQQLRQRKVKAAGTFAPAYRFWVVSDVHAFANDATFPARCDRMLRDCEPAFGRIAEAYPDDFAAGLLLTGDLTKTATRADFRTFDEHVLTRLKDAHGDPLEVFAVPGNHDHLREVIPLDAKSKKKTLHPKKTTNDTYRRSRIAADVADWEHAVGSRFFTFHEWSLKWSDKMNSERTAGPWSVLIKAPRGLAFDLRLVGLNSAIASDGSGENTDTNLWVSDDQVRSVLRDEREARVVNAVMMHHSPDQHLDEYDEEARQLLYQRAHVILHGHTHDRTWDRATERRPLILRVPSLGNPEARSGDDPKFRDGCAVVRLLEDRAQVFFLSHRTPSGFRSFLIDHKKDAYGTPLPDCEEPYLMPRPIFETTE